MSSCLSYAFTNIKHLLFLWSEFTKQILRNDFQEFIDKAFLMATKKFLEKLQSTSPQNQQHAFGEVPAPPPSI